MMETKSAMTPAVNKNCPSPLKILRPSSPQNESTKKYPNPAAIKTAIPRSMVRDAFVTFKNGLTTINRSIAVRE
jgi:hypothetical protein